jgi:hypothetical protein
MSTRVYISGIRTKSPTEVVKDEVYQIAKNFGAIVDIFFNCTTHGWVDYQNPQDAEVAVEQISSGIIFYNGRRLKVKFATTRKIPVPKAAYTSEQVDAVWDMVVDFDLFNTAKEFNTKGMLPSEGSDHLQKAISTKKIRMAEYLIKKVKKITHEDVNAAIKIKNFKLIAAMYSRGARCDDSGYDLAKDMNFVDAIFLFDKKRRN